MEHAKDRKDKPDYGTSYYSYKRKDGKLVPENPSQRDWRAVPRKKPKEAIPEWIHDYKEDLATNANFRELTEVYLYDLTECEVGTFLRLAYGFTQMDIARQDGVSHVAVDCRVNSMIERNVFCDISSRHGVLRRKKNQYE